MVELEVQKYQLGKYCFKFFTYNLLLQTKPDVYEKSKKFIFISLYVGHRSCDF